MNRTISMTIFGVVGALGCATLAFAAPNDAASAASAHRGNAPRFTSPIYGGEQEPAPGIPCKSDWLTSNDEAAARIGWAMRCNVLSNKWYYKFNYEFDAHGRTVQRENLLYPTFARRDDASDSPERWFVWSPEIGQGAATAAAASDECAVPSDVNFFSICIVVPDESAGATPSPTVRGEPFFVANAAEWPFEVGSRTIGAFVANRASAALSLL